MKALNKHMVLIYGRMAHNILGCGIMISDMINIYKFGRVESNINVNSLKIICVDKDLSNGCRVFIM